MVAAAVAVAWAAVNKKMGPMITAAAAAAAAAAALVAMVVQAVAVAEAHSQFSYIAMPAVEAL